MHNIIYFDWSALPDKTWCCLSFRTEHKLSFCCCRDIAFFPTVVYTVWKTCLHLIIFLCKDVSELGFSSQPVKSMVLSNSYFKLNLTELYSFAFEYYALFWLLSSQKLGQNNGFHECRVSIKHTRSVFCWVKVTVTFCMQKTTLNYINNSS